MSILTLNSLLPRTEAFERFVDPARHRPALWRLFVGLALVIGLYLAIMAGLFALAWTFELPAVVQEMQSRQTGRSLRKRSFVCDCRFFLIQKDWSTVVQTSFNY